VDLTTAHEKGVDLGSRVAHIRANGETLLALSQESQRAIEGLYQSLNQLGMQDQLTGAELRQLLGDVRRLADQAKRFPGCS
jgi:hypothetical protein